MKIRLVDTGGKEKLKINEVIKTLDCQADIEEVSIEDMKKLNIKHTPAIIIENVVISGFNNLSINDLKSVFTQFMEA